MGTCFPRADNEIRLIKRDLEEVAAIFHGQTNNKLEEHAMVVWTKTCS
jgi:hypothetical protein